MLGSLVKNKLSLQLRQNYYGEVYTTRNKYVELNKTRNNYVKVNTTRNYYGEVNTTRNNYVKLNTTRNNYVEINTARTVSSVQSSDNGLADLAFPFRPSSLIVCCCHSFIGQNILHCADVQIINSKKEWLMKLITFSWITQWAMALRQAFTFSTQPRLSLNDGSQQISILLHLSIH